MIDLFKLYKQFYQRAFRRPEDELLLAMSTLSHDIAKRAYKLSLVDGFNEDSIELLWTDGVCLRDLEVEKGGFSVYFARNLPDSIKNRHFSVDVPYQKRHSWGQPSEGSVYLMTSPIKPNMVKLGATSLDPDYRASKYEIKYGYHVSIAYSRFVKDPFNLEGILASALHHKRISGNVYGDSNEWYGIGIEEARALLDSCCNNFDTC